MAAITLGLIAAALAAAGAGGAALGGLGAQQNAKSSGAPRKFSGWAYNMANQSTTNPELAQWFRSQIGNNPFIESLTDADLGAILDQYYTKTSSVLGNDTYELDLASALKDIEALNNVTQAPESPDWDAINREAASKIAAENAQINDIYDRNLTRQTNLFNKSFLNNNLAYNDYTRQILSNDYQKNAQLMGGVSNSLDRARTSALEAGASAGLRLSNNINTLLSTQNKQAQQSLDTANNLATAMLNQRQAADSLRNGYSNMLTNDANNRANLISGNSERTTNYQTGLANQYLNTYNRKMTSWENSNAQHSSNPFYGSYSGYNQNNMYKNKQGGNQ